MIELLGTILKNENAIDGQTLEEALSMQQATEQSNGEHEALGALLIRHFGVSEEVIYRALARQFSLEFVPNIIEKADNEIIHQLPVELLKEARLYPLNHDDAVARVDDRRQVLERVRVVLGAALEDLHPVSLPVRRYCIRRHDL